MTRVNDQLLLEQRKRALATLQRGGKVIQRGRGLSGNKYYLANNRFSLAGSVLNENNRITEGTFNYLAGQGFIRATGLQAGLLKEFEATAQCYRAGIDAVC